MKKSLTAMLLALAIVAVPSVRAEGNAADVTDMDALRAAVRADKRAFVASLLSLTEPEAKKFWPLYADYQLKLDTATRDRTVAIEGLVGRDRPASDLYARNFARDTIAADEMEVKARRSLLNKLLRALPAKKAARYLQLESKIRALQAYDIAMGIPLIK
jgi:hypothetical protein